MQTARPAEESRRIFLLIYDFLSVYIKKLHQDMGVLQCLFTSDVVEHHHEPLQFVNTFNSGVDKRRTDGGRRTTDGGRRTTDGGRRTADGGRRTADRGPRSIL